MPTALGIDELKAECRRMLYRLPRTDRISVEEFLEPYVGRRLKRYQDAAATLQRRSVRRSDAAITAFIKSEKTDPGAKENPDPRVIQCRSPVYNLSLGRYLRPMEKALYNVPAGFSKTRAIAKGLNSVARAALLEQKLGYFDNPVIYSLDCSRWDKHIAAAILRIEHSMYLRMNNDPELRELLEWQLLNRSYTKDGLAYVTKGKRNSGDMNTALGNCSLMVLMVRAAMRRLGIRKWEMIDDGDDCLLIVERESEPLLFDLPRVFLAYGQELKIENRATRIEDVVFCQCKYTDVGAAPRMIRPWRKVLSTAACGSAHWLVKSNLPGLLNAVGLCEFALNRGVPILEEFALALIRMSDGTIPKCFSLMDEGVGYRLGLEYKTRDVSVLRGIQAVRSDITPKDRHNFARTWGVTAERQIAIEAVLRAWRLDTYDPYLMPAEHLPGGAWFDARPVDQFVPDGVFG